MATVGIAVEFGWRSWNLVADRCGRTNETKENSPKPMCVVRTALEVS